MERWWEGLNEWQRFAISPLLLLAVLLVFAIGIVTIPLWFARFAVGAILDG